MLLPTCKRAVPPDLEFGSHYIVTSGPFGGGGDGRCGIQREHRLLYRRRHLTRCSSRKGQGKATDRISYRPFCS